MSVPSLPSQNKSPQNNRRLRGRFLIGGITLLVGVAAYYSYRTVRELLLDNLKNNVLLQVQQGGQELNQWLATRKTETATIANTPSLRSMDWERVGPFLKSEKQRLEHYYYLSMISPEGSYYSTKGGKAIGKNLKDRKHVQLSLKGQTYVSDPVISRTAEGTIVAVTTPIQESAQQDSPIVGVLAGLIDIDRLVEVVQGLEYGRGSYAFALNSEGMPIVHPDQSLMSTINDRKPTRLLETEDQNLSAISQRMVARSQGIELTRINNQAVYVAYLPLTEADWSIALVIPQGNIESQLQLLDLIAMVLVGLIVAMLILLWRVQTFERIQLQRTADLAAAANQAKSEFLSNMSHELRTPLNAILGFSQLLQQDPQIPPHQQKQLDIINQSGTHLLALINDILEMSKIEAGFSTLKQSPIELRELLDSLKAMMELKATAKQLGFEFVYSPALPQFIEVDAGKVRQILMNLLSNAIKFTQKGYVSLTVDAIYPASDSSGPMQLRFAVKDTGLGIAPEEIEQLFTPFVQTASGRITQMGTGLGLALSRKFARLMKGDITVDSVVDQGSTFTCWIEVQQIGSAFPSQVFPQIKGLAPGQAPVRMLVAEDQWDSRAVLAQLLQSVGFEVAEAANGEEAVRLVQSWHPHLVWMDMRMPVLDGLAATQQIKARPQPPIIIALTANAFVEDRQEALRVGCDDFVAKPYQIEQIYAKIAEHLGVQYEVVTPDQPSHSETTSQEINLHCMPATWRSQLQEAAQCLDQLGVHQLLEEIPEQHQALKVRLEQLVQDFRFDLICQLV